MIGDPAVRNRGTIGGSISQQRPGGRLSGGAGRARRHRAHDQARDRRPTLSSPACSRPRSSRPRSSPRCSFPKPQAASYQKFRNPASRYAIVGVFVARTAGGVRVAVTGAGPSVFRVPEMEAALAKSFTADAIKDITIPDDRPQLRHPRQRRIPRPPRRRDGPPRRRRLRVIRSPLLGGNPLPGQLAVFLARARPARRGR